MASYCIDGDSLLPHGRYSESMNVPCSSNDTNGNNNNNNNNNKLPSFDSSWLVEPPPGPTVYENVPYISMTIQPNDGTISYFQCLLCDAPAMEYSDAKIKQHCRGAKHFKRFGFLARAYRVAHGIDNSYDDNQVTAVGAKKQEPVELRTYPDCWFQAELPRQTEYNRVAYAERTYDICAKTLRWRCLLCKSGWMGNNDKDPLAHCQGARHSRKYAQFKQAYEERLKKMEVSETETKQHTVENERKEQASSRLEQQTERDQQSTVASSAASYVSPRANLAPIEIDPHWLNSSLKGPHAFNNVPYGQIRANGSYTQWRCLLCESDWMPADGLYTLQHCQQENHELQYKRLEQAKAEKERKAPQAVPQAVSSEKFASPDKSAALQVQPATIDTAWLSVPPPGVDAYDNVLYGEDRIDPVTNRKQWRCLLCSSNWMTANDKDRPRHTQGVKHIKSYNRLMEAYDDFQQSKQHGMSIDISEAPLSTKKMKEPPSITIEQAWLALPLQGSTAYENVAYGETRIGRGTLQWRCLLCNSNWMTANDRDRPRHTNGSKHQKKYAQLVKAFESKQCLPSQEESPSKNITVSYADLVKKNGENSESKAPTASPVQSKAANYIISKKSATKPVDEKRPETRIDSAKKGLGLKETLQNSGQADCHSSKPSSAAETNGRLIKNRSPKPIKEREMHGLHDSFTSIDGVEHSFDESWLSEPPKGQLAFENVPYGELRRGDTGKFTWKCLLCSSDWMVASDDNRFRHCRSKLHAKNYRFLVKAFEAMNVDESSHSSDDGVETSTSREHIPRTFEQADRPHNQLEKRWGDFTSDAFTTPDDTWLPLHNEGKITMGNTISWSLAWSDTCVI